MLRRLYWFSEEINASLAPTKAEFGVDAKADQYFGFAVGKKGFELFYDVIFY